MPKGDRDIGKADPENGTTPISNLLLEVITMANLSGKKRGALSFLWRRTYGWEDKEKKKSGQKYPRKTEDVITLREWSLALRTDVAYASRLIEDLVKKQIIVREPLGTGKGYRYRLNTRIDEWDNSCINVQLLYKLTTQGLYKKYKQELSKTTTPSATDSASSKERLNKDIKESSSGSRGGMGGATTAKGYRSDYTLDMFREDVETLKQCDVFDFFDFYCEEMDQELEDRWNYYSDKENYEAHGCLYQTKVPEYTTEPNERGETTNFTKEEDEIRMKDHFGRLTLIGAFLSGYRELLILEGLITKNEEAGKFAVNDNVIKVLLDSFWPPEAPDHRYARTCWGTSRLLGQVEGGSTSEKELDRSPTSKLMTYALLVEDFNKAKAFLDILPLLKE